jgi:uncharacterized protein (DUF1800 family)
MKIRRLLGTAALVAAYAADTPLAQTPREQTADQQVRHVLNRLAFGPRPGDYDRVRQTGVDAWIEQQLHPERIADPAVTQLVSQLPTYTTSVAELLAEYPRPGQIQQQMTRAMTAADSQMLRQQGAESRRVITELQAARVGRAVASERQLEEVMVDFWLNHFSVFSGKNAQMRYYVAAYEREAIRPHVFGKFRDLLEAVAKSPAMLIYLDNFQSQADTNRDRLDPRGDVVGRGGRGGRGRLVGRAQLPPQPPLQRRASGLNENYARELLELHTLGVDGGYTQQDVIEVARALTGWTILPPDLGGGRGNQRLGAGVIEGHFMFRPQVHDAEAKTVLGVRLRAGRGIEDGEQVLDIVSKHPSTAKYIATKLVTRLVSDQPPPALVNRAAETFKKTNGDLREVVRSIVTSPEFFASSAYRAKVKSPFEVVVSALRAVGAPADPTPRTAQLIATLGQPVYGRQTPDGWPETGDEWINTGSILNRINFGIALAAGRVPGATQQTWPLPIGLRREPREAQVDAVISAFLGGEASPETRAILISGTNPLLATAVADSADIQRMRPPPPDTARVTGVDPGEMRRALAGRAFQQLPALEGLPQIVGLALGSPEFQRR